MTGFESDPGDEQADTFYELHPRGGFDWSGSLEEFADTFGMPMIASLAADVRGTGQRVTGMAQLSDRTIVFTADSHCVIPRRRPWWRRLLRR